MLTGALVLATGCAKLPVQTGNDQIPDVNVEIARAKDGKFETMAWPLVDDVMIDWLDGAYAPGCAVGVALDDELVYLHGYGRAVLGLSAEDWGVGTMGAVGSVSKTFTALAAMRQVEKGWLDLEAPAGDWLPVSGDLADATLFRILSHTAGVGGGTRVFAFAPNWNEGSAVAECAGVATPDPADPACTETHRHELDATWTVGEFATAEADHVETLPGVDVDGDDTTDGWEAVYSNVGYTVAGGIVGAVAQEHGYLGYEQFVWDVVGTWSDNWLSPGQATSLALVHEHRATDIPHRAVGYYDANWGVGAKDWQSGEAWEVVSDGGHWIGPSGGWALTIGDFSRIVIAYRRNQIVSAETRNLMEWPIGYLNLGPDAENFPPYGLGLFVDDVNGTVYHGGDIGPSNGNQLQSSHAAHWSWWPNALPGGVDVGLTLICNNGKGSPTLYSRAKDIVEALQDDPDSRPFENVTHSTQPPRAVVDGGTWVLDPVRAYLIAPAGLPVVPSALSTVALAADLGQGKLTFTGATQRTPLATLSGARIDGSGRLEATGASLLVPTRAATVPLRNVAVSLQVADDGSRLYDGLVTGTVDARDLAKVPGIGAAAVCAAVREAGESCVPCADGARACFAATIGGLTGRRIR